MDYLSHRATSVFNTSVHGSLVLDTEMENFSLNLDARRSTSNMPMLRQSWLKDVQVEGHSPSPDDDELDNLPENCPLQGCEQQTRPRHKVLPNPPPSQLLSLLYHHGN